MESVRVPEWLKDESLRLRRVLLLPGGILLLVILLFGCGQFALWDPIPRAYADTRSRLQADYSPWPHLSLAAIDPAIIEEIQRDLANDPDAANKTLPVIGGQIQFWPTPEPTSTATITPTPTATGGATSVPTEPAAATPTGAESATQPPTPTNTQLTAATPTPTGTPTTPAPTSTSMPTRTRTPTPTATRTNTPLPTTTRTYTPTATIAPTNTYTPTNTAVVPPTNTNTPVPTSVPTDTPTPAPTATYTPTLTLTPTVTDTPTITPVTVQISGRVFHDADYAGGPGAAFGGGDVGLSGVRVEWYNGGVFQSPTTTDASGNYAFTVPNTGAFTIRVVSSTADGGVGALPEQTYEHDGVSGNGGAGAFGGNSPTADDTTTAPGAGVGDTNVTVTVSGLNVTGVDFGFSYNLIVNTADSGQGTLRQFILNANAIAGANSSQFSIPTSDPNYNTLIANAFVIQPATGLPAITNDFTSIDGTTQQSNVGDLRPGLPDVVIDGVNTGVNAHGVHLQASNNTIRNIDIRRFNNGASSGSGIGVMIDGSTDGGDSNTIAENYLTLNSNTTVSAGAIGFMGAANNNTVSNNTLTGNFSDGIEFYSSGSSGNVITGNTITYSGDDGAVIRGTSITFSGNTVTFSQQVSSLSCGIILVGVTNSTIANNTFDNNGLMGGICLTNIASTGNTIGPNNVISNHTGPGIYSDVAGSANNRFTQNSISANAGIGIDLDNNDVTANDAGDGDTGPNDLMNFPVIYSVTISGGNVTITGEARPGATIEFSEAAADPTGYGEGFSYIGAAVEGSGDDTNTATGTVDATANQFTFTFAAGSLSVGDPVTATATDGSGNTSEFAQNVLAS